MRPCLLLLCAALTGCLSGVPKSAPSLARVRGAGIIVHTRIVEVATSAKKIDETHKQQQAALTEMEQLVVGLRSRIADELKPDLDRLRATLNEAEIRERMQGVQIAALVESNNGALSSAEQARIAMEEVKRQIDVLEKDRDDWKEIASAWKNKAGDFEKSALKAEAELDDQVSLTWKWRLIALGLIAGMVALFWFKKWLMTIPIIGPIIAKVFL